MNLQELRYFVAVADHRHFGRAAEACHVSQPTLSGQLRRLEEALNVQLFERTNKRVLLTPVGETILEHARRALAESNQVEALARASHDQLCGPLRLGIIPTLAPYLMPHVLGPLRKQCPDMAVELWEDLTHSLLEKLGNQQLDAALLATNVTQRGLTAIELFSEPFLAALPRGHRLATARTVDESELADDLLVLADGHCLAIQALHACGRNRPGIESFRAASLETLVHLVAAGYGTTLIPNLAAETLRSRKVVLRPLAGEVFRTVRLASRQGFARPKALVVLSRIIREAVR
jgi:LysR family hydrogen peroxide-inducible transcriptional activator